MCKKSKGKGKGKCKSNNTESRLMDEVYFLYSTIGHHAPAYPDTPIQIGGDHYQDFEIQPIDFITKNELDYIQGNVIKYICRFRKKGGKEDLLKIKHYCDILIEKEYKDD